jgi:hypothetical protein
LRHRCGDDKAVRWIAMDSCAKAYRHFRDFRRNADHLIVPAVEQQTQKLSRALIDPDSSLGYQHRDFPKRNVADQ